MKEKSYLPVKQTALFQVALLFFAVVFASTAVSAWAAGNQVVINLTQKKVVKGPGGKETYEAAEKIFPGDVIEYTAECTNSGNTAVTNFKPQIPIPVDKGLVYVAGTAKPAKAEASIDGVRFAPMPLKRKVRLPNGKEAIRDIPYSQYKFIRWNLGTLPAGKTVTVSARVRLAAPGR